jgi:hypothetical protein
MKDGHEIDQLSQLPEFRNTASFGWVSRPSYMLGQNDGFSDGFLTKIRVVTCRSGQPGKSNDPVKPMKSIDQKPSAGFPPASAIHRMSCDNVGIDKIRDEAA